MNWLTEWKQSKSKHKAIYDDMRQHATFCWACGRSGCFKGKPREWHAAWFIQRCHLVNQPRLLDRRVVNLLCPLCHENYDGNGDLELSHMIALKAIFDPHFFDLELLQHCSIRILPPAKELPAQYLMTFQIRKGLTRHKMSP